MENSENYNIDYVETAYIAQDLIDLCEKHNIVTFSSQPAIAHPKKMQVGYIDCMLKGDGQKLGKILEQNGDLYYSLAKRTAKHKQKIWYPTRDELDKIENDPCYDDLENWNEKCKYWAEHIIDNTGYVNLAEHFKTIDNMKGEDYENYRTHAVFCENHSGWHETIMSDRERYRYPAIKYYPRTWVLSVYEKHFGEEYNHICKRLDEAFDKLKQ